MLSKPSQTIDAFAMVKPLAHGMLVAGELSKNLGLLDQSELELLREGSSAVWAASLRKQSG